MITGGLSEGIFREVKFEEMKSIKVRKQHAEKPEMTGIEQAHLKWKGLGNLFVANYRPNNRPYSPNFRDDGHLRPQAPQKK